MKKYSVFLAILLSLYSQAFAESKKWIASDIVGCNFKLIDAEVYQSFSFGSPDYHLVLATVGTVGGPITIPLWYWEIDRNGILNIKDDQGKIRFSLKKLYQRNGIVGVEQSGKKVEYEKSSVKTTKRQRQ